MYTYVYMYIYMYINTCIYTLNVVRPRCIHLHFCVYLYAFCVHLRHTWSGRTNKSPFVSLFIYTYVPTYVYVVCTRIGLSLLLHKCILHINYAYLSTRGGHQTQNNYDCQNLNKFSRESPKLSSKFHGSPQNFKEVSAE